MHDTAGVDGLLRTEHGRVFLVGHLYLFRRQLCVQGGVGHHGRHVVAIVQHTPGQNQLILGVGMVGVQRQGMACRDILRAGHIKTGDNQLHTGHFFGLGCVDGGDQAVGDGAVHHLGI